MVRTYMHALVRTKWYGTRAVPDAEDFVSQAVSWHVVVMAYCAVQLQACTLQQLNATPACLQKCTTRFLELEQTCVTHTKRCLLGLTHSHTSRDAYNAFPKQEYALACVHACIGVCTCVHVC